MISQLRFVHKQVYSILEVRCFAFRRYPTESMAIVVRRSIVRTYKLHQRQNPHEPAAGQAILSNLIKLQSIPKPPIPSNRKSGCTQLFIVLPSHTSTQNSILLLRIVTEEMLKSPEESSLQRHGTDGDPRDKPKCLKAPSAVMMRR